MIVGPRRRRRTLASLRARAVLPGLLAFAVLPLTTLPAHAAGPSPSETGVVVGTAAASGAAYAASRAMATMAADGMVELGRVAATTTLPALAKPKPTAAPAPAAPARWTWKGWRSGVAGREAQDGSFGAWRGEPVTVVAVWSDTTADAQTQLTSVGDYDGYIGDLDIAVGGLVRGETWQQAAQGAFVDRWTTAVRNLRAMRQGKGTTYVRIAHEMNGDWMAWGVNASNLAAYKTGYRLYASIVRKEFPQARLTWSPNGGNHSNVSIDQFYPGDDVVDVVGPDIYDGWPEVTSAALWKQSSEMWLTPQSPRGLAAWQVWATRKGKPLALPEWGLPYGDHPEFIRGVHDELAAHAARPGKVANAGRFVYDCYFNAEPKFKILNGPNTSAGKLYASLTWGS